MKTFFFNIKNDLDFQLDAEVALNEEKNACFTHILLPNVRSQMAVTIPAMSRASLELVSSLLQKFRSFFSEF